MNKYVSLGIVAIVLLGLGAGSYFFIGPKDGNQSRPPNEEKVSADTTGTNVKTNQETDSVSDPSASATLTAVEQLSASAFATKVERYTQKLDFAKMYELVCQQDTVGATKTEYVKAMTNVWGSNRLTSFEVKSVLEEGSGATVQLVENTSNGASSAELMTLEKSGPTWCFRSNITKIIGQIKDFKNISLSVTKVDRPYSEQYQGTPTEGMERVRIAVAITNKSDYPLVCHALDGGETQCGEFFFHLRDSAGAIYTSAYVSKVGMPQFTLAPHATVSGSLGFEIPVGSSDYTLVFKDLGYGTDITTVSAGF